MKRSEINRAVREAGAAFAQHGWALPPRPRWDVTDFGLGDFERQGLVLVNLAEEREYCEKLMFARRGQTTPAHMHAKKKEDIICRAGELVVRLWAEKPAADSLRPAVVKVNGEPREVRGGDKVVLAAGSRVTLWPGVWHEFYPTSEVCVIGEVSTANDDAHDNFFADERIGRFPGIEEDEPAAVQLVSERTEKS